MATRTTTVLTLSLLSKFFVFELGTLSDIESRASEVSRWFIENALLQNPTKTEAVVFCTSQRLSQVNKSQGVWVAGAHVHFTDAVKLLGVTLTQLCLLTDKHIIDATHSCHYHIRTMRFVLTIFGAI